MTISLRIEPTDSSFIIYVGEKPLQTPAKKILDVPAKALAEALTEELTVFFQKEKKEALKFPPLYQYAVTALDLVPPNRATIVDQLTKHLETELLCHFAEEPPELIKRQKEVWQPITTWFEERWKAPLVCGFGVMPFGQNPDALDALNDFIEQKNDFYLVGLQATAGATGSILLALALAERERHVGEILLAAELESDFEAEKWGADHLAQKRRESIEDELQTLEKWFGTLVC